MSESGESLLQVIKHVQALNEQNKALFEECDRGYQAMRPELQELSNRAAELMVDDEFRARVRRWMDSDEQRRYKSAVSAFQRGGSPLWQRYGHIGRPHG
jgi:hypothetical protein